MARGPLTLEPLTGVAAAALDMERVGGLRQVKAVGRGGEPPTQRGWGSAEHPMEMRALGKGQ